MSYDYADAIAKALATQGGHLFIGRGGFSLHYLNRWLSGYDCETVKAAAIAAGLPVVDSRNVDLGKVAELAIRGPMIAVGRPADPRPGTRSLMRRSSRSQRLTLAPVLTCATCLSVEGGGSLRAERALRALRRERGRERGSRLPFTESNGACRRSRWWVQAISRWTSSSPRTRSAGGSRRG